MIYTVEWTFLASESYFDELEFIYKKWNLQEVHKFEELVVSELIRLSMIRKLGNSKLIKLFSSYFKANYYYL